MTRKILRQMVKEVRSDLEDRVSDVKTNLVNTTREVSKEVGYTGIKIMYPILGNLSSNLQNRLEKCLGHENYNAGKATITSILANPYIYPAISGISSYLLINGSSDSRLGYSSLIALSTYAFGLSESIFRAKISNEQGEWPNKFTRENPEAIGSIAGKIISLPFDVATYIGDYVSNVYHKAKNKTQGGEK